MKKVIGCPSASNSNCWYDVIGNIILFMGIAVCGAFHS